ncbi:hypothetical protein [Bradyrhizobium lupini]|uniref:hypothetical protein n=1 Tax=Rhizobium lupini TaxID=136996 RepID=UPI0034C5E10A
MPKKKKQFNDPAFQLSAPGEFLFRVSERLEEMRAVYKEGNPLGLFDALVIALQSGIVLPDWAIEAAIDELQPLVAKGVTTGKGQTGNTLAAYKTDMVHYRRWSTVEQCRVSGKTLEESCYEAEKSLHGCFGEGGFESMKKSYQTVSANLADSKERLRYYRGLSVGRQLTGTEAAGRRLKFGVLEPPKGKE